jgi:hypothetical protein
MDEIPSAANKLDVRKWQVGIYAVTLPDSVDDTEFEATKAAFKAVLMALPFSAPRTRSAIINGWSITNP